MGKICKLCALFGVAFVGAFLGSTVATKRIKEQEEEEWESWEKEFCDDCCCDCCKGATETENNSGSEDADTCEDTNAD